MNEEEKKIVSQIKDVAQYKTIIRYGDGHDTIAWIPRPETTMVLNNYTAKILYDLIEKQQEEIEKLKNANIKLSEEKQLNKEGMIIANIDITEDNLKDFISKDKIRDKIKKLEKSKGLFAYVKIATLKDLLEE